MKWFYNLRISVKITISTAVFILFILVIGFMGFNAVYNENEKLKTLNNDRLVPIYDLGEAKAHLMSIRLAVLHHVANDSAEVKKEQEELILKNEKEYFEHFNKYKATSLNKDEEKGIEALESAYPKYKEVREQVLKKSMEGNKLEASRLTNSEGKATFEKTIKEVEGLVDIQINVAKGLYDESEKEFDNVTLRFPILIGMCVLIGFIISFITVKSIVSPVKKVTGKLNEIAENGGDLTQRIGIDSKDEIGQLSKSFDGFIGSLQSMIREVSRSAKNMAESSRQLSNATGESNKVLEQIAQAVNNIASSTSDNVAVMEETTASLTEASRFSESTAEASRRTNEHSVSVRGAAEKGAEQVSDIVSSMMNIADSSKEVADVIDRLNQSSQKIGDIVQLITNIAGQTNLLALNASIEAARAGEAGKGFNVVADEIRKLADESSKAAKDIIELIKENRVHSENAVETVNNVDKLITVSVEKASEVKVSMDNIIENIKDVTEQIGAINEDVIQQATIAEEITTAMNSIAANANDMAAGTEEISASIEEQVGTMEELEATAYQLSDVAERLNKITSGFKT